MGGRATEGPRNRGTRGTGARWLAAILWTFVVLGASSDPFSASHTGSILQTILARIGHPLPAAEFDVLHVIIRKAAHLTEYGILAALWLNALRGKTRWSWRLALTAIGIAALVATTDEIHQSFVPSRGPSPYDVMLDIAGATVAVSAMRIKMLLSVLP